MLPKPHITNNSFGIYIHIPFCQTKCPYCDFNSYETSRPELKLKETFYTKSLCDELLFLADKYKLEDRKVDTIFFGGGTPSLLSAGSVSKILASIKNTFSTSEFLEVTMEANPKSVVEEISEDKIKGFIAAGINRISFGVQSLRTEKLDFLGRWHTVEDSRTSLSFVKEQGISDINIDSISGTILDTKESWSQELHEIIKLNTTHLSSYILTLEPGTVFGKRAKKGEVFIASNDLQADIYELTQELISKAGYRQYEVSNYAKTGFECAHNLLYWRGGEYLGLGAGAHSFLRFKTEDGIRWSNTPDPKIYSQRITIDKEASQRIDPVTIEQINLERVSFGLRLVEGISTEIINLEKVPQFLFDKGYLALEQDMLFIPKSVFRLADGIISELS